MRFRDVQDDFAFDGAVRELSLPDTDVGLWQRVLDCIRSTGERLRFTLDSAEAALPEQVATIFELLETCFPLLAFTVGGIRFTTSFVGPDAVELIFGPEDVSSPERFDALVGWSQRLADLTERPALVRHEGLPGPLIFRVAPAASAGLREI